MSEHTTTQPPLYLAICLCIVDELPHEQVWKYWIGDGSQASLYLHAKHPEKITGEWAKSKLLGISHEPNWNDVKIIKAMLSLAQEALKDERVTHVYFGTESCIPITTLQQALSTLSHDTSFLSTYEKSQASRFEERECWSPLEQYIPTDAIYKALPGWCVLCRSHVQAILDIAVEDLWTAFVHVWAPEEVYFATCLALLGLLDKVECKSLVHAEWNEHARNHCDRAHPKEYDDEFNEQLVEYVKRKGSVFLRKVKRRMPLNWWKRVVLGEYDAGDKRPRNDDVEVRRYRDDNRDYHDEGHLHHGRQRRRHHHSERHHHDDDYRSSDKSNHRYR